MKRILALCKKNYRFGEVKFKPSIKAGEFKWMTMSESGTYAGSAIVEYDDGTDKVISKKHFNKYFRIFA